MFGQVELEGDLPHLAVGYGSDARRPGVCHGKAGGHEGFRVAGCDREIMRCGDRGDMPHRVGAAWRGTGWRRDARQKGPPPLACWAARIAVTAWSLCLPRRPAHRAPHRNGRHCPGAVRAGDRAAEIGDGSDHCRPGFGRCVLVRAIVAARMKAEAAGSVQSRNPASPQIRFCACARNRLRHCE